jgi:hypothetical protein
VSILVYSKLTDAIKNRRRAKLLDYEMKDAVRDRNWNLWKNFKRTAQGLRTDAAQKEKEYYEEK